METNERFAVFILTHGRPDKQITYHTLQKQGYTGELYFIVDNEDDTLDEYQRLYKDKVIVFDKLDINKRYDSADISNERRSIFYARNACFEIAKNMGIDYFLELDDDYKFFSYKFTPDLRYKERNVLDLDRLFSAYLEFYKKSGALTIALAQNGDFIGGRQSDHAVNIRLLRKCMNTFFCSTKKPFQFYGRVNEDVNTYSVLGHRGELLLTVLNNSIAQGRTQSAKGGMTELYSAEGTYIKSFYPVMYCPSFVRLGMMGDKHLRMHHRIRWDNAVPCILNEKHRRME